MKQEKKDAESGIRKNSGRKKKKEKRRKYKYRKSANVYLLIMSFNKPQLNKMQKGRK
jgi:hypothetical protein